MKKAIIAMSGGVDSSVAAYFMVKKGFDCIGATMKLYDNEDIGISSEKTCCSLSDIEDARSVARRLGMPYYVFNFKEDFEEKVIDKFIRTYELGGTPNPCIDCNRYLKFEKLMQRMEELGYDYVVTGHYADIEEKDG
ncbi:MAG: tRNA 2-thiouridine(34) synthase MnmA, partial [Eubacterium sp.]|nr:tRNA 2-thiouridine(34) synthase MnmA [Eubacterium sp.]